MNLPVVIAITGGVALLVGLFGGGVKAKEVVVPRLSTLPRIFSSLIGLILIGIAIWLSPIPQAEVPPTQIPSTEVSQALIHTPISTPRPTDMPTVVTRVSTVDNMVMVYIPAGSFDMGNDTAYDNEKPVHTVALDPFWIDQTEVTNLMYANCVQAGVCQPPSNTNSSNGDIYYGDPRFNYYPVTYVSWDDAKTYCEWSGRRLPTEAEWEKAARGTDRRQYPWGNDFLVGVANICDVNCSIEWANKSLDDGYAQTAPAGNYPAGKSPYGVLDMAGNVSEWVADWYDENYYKLSPQSNPRGPSDGNLRVARGGAFPLDVNDARTVSRGRFEPYTSKDYIGFRCAASP